MLESCTKHPHEMGVALCRRCGQSWCSICLVYSFGPKKPPFCMSCAMVAGGVRTNATLPAMPRKQLKAQMQAPKKAAAKAAAKDAGPKSQSGEAAAAFTETDWSAPWSEARSVRRTVAGAPRTPGLPLEGSAAPRALLPPSAPAHGRSARPGPRVRRAPGPEQELAVRPSRASTFVYWGSHPSSSRALSISALVEHHAGGVPVPCRERREPDEVERAQRSSSDDRRGHRHQTGV